jgi:acyl-CoA synthetase (NDP forming)
VKASKAKKGSSGRAISREQVARLLAPKSVAVIGVSERPGTAGRNAIATLDQYGYKGTIHIVARNARAIDGRPAVQSVSELPDGIDLAVLTVPNASVLETVQALASKRIGGIMCFASGFAEVGGEMAGVQNRLTEIAHANDIAFAGPNCLGFTNLVANLQITFMAARPMELPRSDARIDVVAQSGGLAGVISRAAALEGVGFSYSITTGNEAVLGLEDYMPFLVENEQSRVIAMLGETIRRPEEFLRHAAAARAKKKPIVLLHLGKSAAGRESAKSHTGALAGDYQVMEAFVRAEGVILVDTLDELVDTAVVLAHYPQPPVGAAGILTDSGAFKGFSIDYCEDVGLPIAAINRRTQAALKEVLPEFTQLVNPVDMTAQAAFDHSMYTNTTRALMEDPAVGGVCASIMGAGNTEIALERARAVAAGKVANGKPLLCAFLGGDLPLAPELKPTLASQGIPFFKSPERALRALARATAYGLALRASRGKGTRPKVAAAKIPTGAALTEVKGKAALKAAGVPIPKGGLAKTLAEAKTIAARIKYPVVIKAMAAELTHKTEAGGVIVNIKSPKELGEAWKKLQANIKKNRPDLALDGVLVEEMAKAGVEMVIGARRDPAWGATLMIGLGGIWTEALKDVRFLPANASVSDIVNEIGKLKGAKLLDGFRGQKPRDVAALADAAARIGALMEASPGLDEIDVNPLIVHAAGDGVVAVDALLVGGSPAKS